MSEDNACNEANEFHFIAYYLGSRMTTVNFYRTFVICDTPEKFYDNFKEHFRFYNKERLALVNITEQEYLRLKNLAHTEIQKTGKDINPGFVANFSKDYKTTLNPRDTTLE